MENQNMYVNGKVYKICNVIKPELVYVGSTCNTLEYRFAKHKGVRNNQTRKHRMLYALMNELGVEHFFISLLEECGCESKLQLLEREKFWIKEIGTLNKAIPTRTKKQWAEDNVEHVKELQHQRYLKNKEAHLEKCRQYAKDNTEQIKDYRKQHYIDNIDKYNEYNKQKYERNKEAILAKNKEYRIAKASEIKLKRSEKIECQICGTVITRDYQAAHRRSKKCQAAALSKSSEACSEPSPEQ